jgi:hypothetical protein
MSNIENTKLITNLGIFSSLLIFLATLYFSFPIFAIYLVISIYYYRHKEIKTEEYYNFLLINIAIIIYVIIIACLIKFIDSFETIPAEVIFPALYGY